MRLRLTWCLVASQMAQALKTPRGERAPGGGGTGLGLVEGILYCRCGRVETARTRSKGRTRLERALDMAVPSAATHGQPVRGSMDSRQQTAARESW